MAWENITESIRTSAEDSLVCMNGSSINHSLMKNVHDLLIKGSRLNCSGYRIQTKAMTTI